MAMNSLKLLAEGFLNYVADDAPPGTEFDSNNEHCSTYKLIVEENQLNIQIEVPAFKDLMLQEDKEKIKAATIKAGQALRASLINLGLEDKIDFLAEERDDKTISITPAGRKKLQSAVLKMDDSAFKLQAVKNLNFINNCLDRDTEKTQKFLRENVFNQQANHPLLGINEAEDGRCYLYLKGEIAPTLSTLYMQIAQAMLKIGVPLKEGKVLGQLKSDFNNPNCPNKQAIEFSKDEYQQLKQICKIVDKPQTTVVSKSLSIFDDKNLEQLKATATANQMRWHPVDRTKADKENEVIKIILPATGMGQPPKIIELDKKINGMKIVDDSPDVLQAVAKLYAGMKPNITTVTIKRNPMDIEKVKQLAEILINEPYKLSFKVEMLPGQQPVVTTDHVLHTLSPATQRKYKEINEGLAAPSPGAPSGLTPR